jgi:hypothetical protein
MMCRPPKVSQVAASPQGGAQQLGPPGADDDRLCVAVPTAAAAQCRHGPRMGPSRAARIGNCRRLHPERLRKDYAATRAG